MSNLKYVKNVVIDFSIIQNSNLEVLKKELKIIIDTGKYICLWSNKVSPKNMESWCKKNDLWHYIWEYLPKDSFNYGKVDFIIDPDKKIVDRFKSNGIPGNCIKKME